MSKEIQSSKRMKKGLIIYTNKKYLFSTENKKLT